MCIICTRNQKARTGFIRGDVSVDYVYYREISGRIDSSSATAREQIFKLG